VHRSPSRRITWRRGGRGASLPDESRRDRRPRHEGRQAERRAPRAIILKPLQAPDGAPHMPGAPWVRPGRSNAPADAEQEGLVPLCPGAPFEVAPKSDRREDLQRKIRACLANGAQIAALTDPDECPPMGPVRRTRQRM